MFPATRTIAAALLAAFAGAAGAAPPPPPDAQVVAALAPGGTLRIGVYPGSPTSLVRDPVRQRGGDEEVDLSDGERVPVLLAVIVAAPPEVDVAETLDVEPRGGGHGLFVRGVDAFRLLAPSPERDQ